MNEISQIKLNRKFSCKRKVYFLPHCLLIGRCLLSFELLLICCNCIVNMSLYFHISHIYTTEFWTNQDIASSNLGFAIASLLLIVYTVKFQQVKPNFGKDLHFTIGLLHALGCIIYNELSLSWQYTLFALVVGGGTVIVGGFVSMIVQQNRLHSQIHQIEQEDRKTYKQANHDPLEHHQLTEPQFQQQI